MTLHIEQLGLLDGGTLYLLPGGEIVFHYGELPEDAPADVREQRRRWLTWLDLNGFETVTSMQELAEVLSDDDD